MGCICSSVKRLSDQSCECSLGRAEGEFHLQHRVKPAERSRFQAAAALGASSSRLSGRRLCGKHFVLQQQLHLHLSFDTFAATTAA